MGKIRYNSFCKTQIELTLNQMNKKLDSLKFFFLFSLLLKSFPKFHNRLAAKNLEQFDRFIERISIKSGSRFYAMVL